MNKPKKLSAICTGAVALALLVVVSAAHIRREPTPEPDIPPVSAYTREDRVTAPPTPQPALVGEKTAKAEPISTPPAQIDFEPQKPSDRPAILTFKEPPRDNHTSEPSSGPTPSRQAPVEPKMGDTRIVDGQKQVYFLGFGWIEDNDTSNECVYVEDMYENGNKGGTMDGGEVGRICGDIHKQVGTMD